MTQDLTRSSRTPFCVLFQDDHYVVIDKPSGILVHPSEISNDRVSCLTLLRDQLGAWIYPVHRLDRATSGALVFALTSEDARLLKERWSEVNEAGQPQVSKTYHAIVRGYVNEAGEIDKPLRETPEKPRQTARTLYRKLGQVEYPDPVGRYPTARYSWVEAKPLTGRYHQIRKHLFGISHPIVGDTVYGDGEHNRYFRAKFGIHRLLLHAHVLEFAHPRTNTIIRVESPVPEELKKVVPTFL